MTKIKRNILCDCVCESVRVLEIKRDSACEIESARVCVSVSVCVCVIERVSGVVQYCTVSLCILNSDDILVSAQYQEVMNGNSTEKAFTETENIYVVLPSPCHFDVILAKLACP